MNGTNGLTVVKNEYINNTQYAGIFHYQYFIRKDYDMAVGLASRTFSKSCFVADRSEENFTCEYLRVAVENRPLE